MSALGKALSAMINGEKPHSSISDWIEILSSPRYNEEDYEGIPELVDSINLQPTGPTEASRAIRKKLKYGDVDRQLRALTILKALVENCGIKFQTSFANDRLTERIKVMASDSMTDEDVKKKLMMVLASWHRQFKDDPKMSLVAGLYHTCGGRAGKKATRSSATPSSPSVSEMQQKKARDRTKQREESRLKELHEKEVKRKEKKESAVLKTKRKSFDFGQEKPQVISSISTASQASNNLVNALKLVNREEESIEANARVQECLTQAKAARRAVVRYIQLVEDEEFIGTLIDSNERVIAALELYDRMLKNADQDSDDSELAGKMDRLTTSESEVYKLQERQRVAVQRAIERSDSMENLFNGTPGRGVTLHPDLQDLTFGELGASRTGLPPPITPDDTAGEHDQALYDRPGSLSDYSDYVSSDEERHSANATVTASGSRSQNRIGLARGSTGGKDALIDLDDDPFADPAEVSTSGVQPMKVF